MEKEVLEFLKNHNVSVLGILQEDTSIHSAALHYANTDDPIAFYFLTEKTSRKCRPLVSGKAVNASFVVGFDESEFATFQAEGIVEIVSNTEGLTKGWEAYIAKYPEREKGRTNPAMTLLKFTPSWWRMTDMKTDPPTILSSEK
jgi:general stress protein 26